MLNLILKFKAVYRKYRETFHNDYDIDFTVKCKIESLYSLYGSRTEEDAIACIRDDLEMLETAIATGRP